MEKCSSVPNLKKKSQNETNNYLGISVLIPVAKIFDKVFASHITIHLNIYNILNSGKHGFRTATQTALHKLL